MSQENVQVLSKAERIAIRSLVEESIPDHQSGETLPLDTMFSLLAHPGRRYVLTYLIQAEGFVSMSELVSYVVERSEHTMTDRAFRHRVSTALTHTHLPKLHEEGFVDYNIERQIIQETEKTRLVAPYLKVALVHRSLYRDTIEASHE